MHKKNLALGAAGIVLLAAGFAGGHAAQHVHPKALLTSVSDQVLGFEKKADKAPIDKTPVEKSQPVAQTAVSTAPAIDISKTWPQWESAQQDWRNIHAKHSVVTADDATLKALVNQADQAKAAGDSGNAYRRMQDALQLNADYAYLWIKYAEMADAYGNNWESLNAYIIAEALKPDQQEKIAIYQGLAKIYAARGDQSQEQQIAALEKWLAVDQNADVQKQLDTLRGKILKITDFNKREDGETPEACFTFSWALRNDGTISYEDFISVEPKLKLAAIAMDKQLCLRGFSYGKEYKVTLKVGLPAASEAKLSQADTRQITFSNRALRLSFQNDTYIVPRLNSLGVPLRGVNVDVAHVEIMQVNDRNLVSQVIDNRVLRNETYSYAANEMRSDYGRSLWEGYMDLKKVDNKTSITAIPFGQLIKNPVPGLYAVIAQPAKREDETSTTNLKYQPDDNKDMVIQWLVVTDVGLTTYEGQDGLHMAIRSYDTGKPLHNVKLRLLSRDNTILADAMSDSSGHVAFADALIRGEGGKAPKLVQAFGPGDDFTFMDLQQPSLDLSENKIEGREAPRKTDAFMYSERGIYRPGDTMHLSALLRNVDGNALEKAPPLTVKVLRPDGVLFKKLLVNAHDETLGGYHTEIALPENARMGVWSAEVYSDPTEPALASYSWQVEDFVPARMEVKLALPENAMLEKDKVLSVPVQADYLYGAPASQSKGDASLDLREAAENPFKEFADYQFGLLDAAITPQHVELSLPETDEKGAAKLDIDLKSIPATSKPLEAMVHASVFDDTGRAVNRTAIIPVSRNEAFLGLKEGSGSQTDNEWNFSADRTFQLVAVDRAGKAVAQKGLRYRLVREEYRYDWYAANGNRNYQSQIYDVSVTSGAVDVDATKPSPLSFEKLDYGTYRLEVTDPTQTVDRLTAAGLRFNVGWTERAMTSKDKPDTLQLRLDRKNYRPGETAHLFIKAPFEGEAELVLAREKLLEQRSIHITKEGVTVDISVGDNWGPGVYALVHAYRPGEKITSDTKNKAKAPGRAIGAIWAGMDPSPRTLDVTMTVPDIMVPRQKLTVPVEVKGARHAEITVSAVDEGILQLTDFNTPNPEKYFFAKRRLGVELRDSYGRLLDPNIDAIGTIRTGGDQSGRSAPNLPGKWVKPVALFSGPVTLDERGKAEIQFDVPEFNGKLRLMAVAYDRDRLGHAEEEMIVRDKVVVNLGLPRFLAPEDHAKLTLNLDNVDGADGEAKLSFTTTGGIAVSGYPERLTLKAKKKQQVQFDLKAETLGVANVMMALILPDGTSRQQNWDLTVRPTQSYQTKVIQGILEPGKSVTIDEGLLKKVMPSDAIVSVAFGAVPDMQLTRAVRELDRYPYGCLEQTSSRVLPLLYLPDLLKQSGIKDERKAPTKEAINEAIAHILSMQRGDGSFGLWNGYNDTEDYLSLYAIDVLQRAQAQGYDVADYALNNALNWVHDQVKSGEFEVPVLHRRAYAYYLLAKAGLIEPGQIRYFAERYQAMFTNRLAPAFLAAALTQIGDASHAEPLWKKAMADAAKAKDAAPSHIDYGSDLRDRLIVLTLAAEAGQPVAQFAATLNGDIARQSWLSTQEDGQIILAAHAMYHNSKSVKLTLNDDAVNVEQGGPVMRSWSGPDWQALKAGQRFHNDGDQPVHYTVAVNAIPKETQPAVSEGFKISRSFYTRNGKKVALDQVKANDMVIAVIDGEVTDTHVTDQSLLVDLLPSGFELESSQFGKGQDVSDFAWVGLLTEGTYQELRDDRFIAAFDPTKLDKVDDEETSDDKAETVKGPGLEANHFRFAYAVRAVTQGKFVVPATAVEAMYQPEFHALGSPETVTISK